MRTLHNPSAGTTIVGILKPHEGGSGQVTGSTALNAMTAIAAASKNQASGVTGLDKDGRVLASVISPELFSSVSINGPKSVNIGSDTVYIIRNYDSFSEYAISTTLGSVSALDDLITYSAPSVVGEAGFFVNGREFKIQITGTAPATPVITSPVNLSNLTATSYTFTTSAFSVSDASSTHASTDWWLSTRPDFSDTVSRVNDSTNDKTTWTVNDLTDGQTYYVNARHKSSSGIYSDWSPGAQFAISIPAPATPSITSHANDSTINQGNQTFTSSAYSIAGNASPHLTSDWQLSVVSDFSTIYASAIESSGNLLSWAVTGLADGSAFYLRTRHKATNGKSSNWSTPIRINVLYAFVYNSIVSTSSNNFNMKSAAISAGWNQTSPLFMHITLTSGVLIGSSSTTNYAFDTGSGFPAGSTLKLTLNSGAIIAGAGGNGGLPNYGTAYSDEANVGGSGNPGGPGLFAQVSIDISNSGTIAGGGGGGGAGGSTQNQPGGGILIGGSGGRGAGPGAAAGGNVGQDEQTYSRFAGNGGGGGAYGAGGGSGTAAINGQGGSAKGQGGAGGPAGIAVTGNANIAWATAGTRLGLIV